MAKRSPLHERPQCLGILGLSEGASEDDIRKAYKKLALQYHPDKNNTDGAKEKFQEIGYAYKYLTEGPSAFETEDHLVPEDILIRIFEEMFFPGGFSFGFGSHFRFMFTDSDNDEYFYYDVSSDDDDDDYYGLYSGRYSSGGRQYQNRFPEPSKTGQTQHPQSKKSRNKKKRNRNKAEKTSTRQNTFSRNSEQSGCSQQNTSSSAGKRSAPKENANGNIDARYTDDISSVREETDARKSKTKTVHAEQMKNSAENVDRPRQNDPMQQKPYKKQKRKLEAEQWRREKEMEEIAAELLEKQEKERQKREKEQEKLAAKKQEELADEDKENDTMYWFEDTKKSRRGRKNERRQTDSETVIHTEKADSIATSGRTTPSDIEQKATPVLPSNDPCDGIRINDSFEPSNKGLYSFGNRQHTQGPSVNNNKTQIPSGFDQHPLGSRVTGNMANFNSGSATESRQQARNSHQDNFSPMHPGFTVTGLPSKRYGLDHSETDHGEPFTDGLFNMKTSNSQPPKTTSKGAEMTGNMNSHYSNQNLFETAIDQNGGKGDSSNLRGGLTHSKGGNSNGQNNSWYGNIGGPAPSFAPGHMTEPYVHCQYTRDVQQPGSGKSETRRGGYVQQPESRKSETRNGGYVQQPGSGKSETRRGGYVQQSESGKSETRNGGYVQQPGSGKSETRRDGYVNHTFHTVEDSISNGFLPYGMHSPYSQKRSDGYPFTKTLHNQSHRQHHNQPQNQRRQTFNEFNDPGYQDNNYSFTGENFSKQAKSKDQSSKPASPRKTENQSTAPKSQARNQPTHTGKSKNIDQPAHQSLDSINDINGFNNYQPNVSNEWKNGGKTATKPSPKPSKPVKKEVDDLDSIDDIDPVFIYSDDKQTDPNKDMHATGILNDFETKLKLSDFGNSSNDFLCRSKLDVPKSIFSDSIKKYYA